MVPNGVNTSKFDKLLNESKPINTDTINVGFLGTLKPWHGVPTLIEAFAIAKRSFSPLNLLIVGDGPELAQLQAQVDEFSVDIRDSVEWFWCHRK